MPWFPVMWMAHAGWLAPLIRQYAIEPPRLELGVVDVGRDDGLATGHLVADELGRDGRGDGGAEGLVGVLLRRAVPSKSSRRWFSRIAMNSISWVTIPWRASCIWVTRRPGLARRGGRT
jgi:hypothetical protein